MAPFVCLTHALLLPPDHVALQTNTVFEDGFEILPSCAVGATTVTVQNIIIVVPDDP